MQRPPLYVPDDAKLSDPSTLTQHLLEASKYARGSVDGNGMARLLEAAASTIQRLEADAKIQHGLAVASQTLSTELAYRLDELRVRLYIKRWTGDSVLSLFSHLTQSRLFLRCTRRWNRRRLRCNNNRTFSRHPPRSALTSRRRSSSSTTTRQPSHRECSA